MEKSLKTVLPVIKRARGFRLYGTDGKKYLDFFQEEGKSILGSRPKKFSISLKGEIEKGCFYSFPSPHEKGLERAVRTLAETADLYVAFFPSELEAAGFLSSAFDRDSTVDKFDSLRLSLQDGRGGNEKKEEKNTLNLCRWYPFCGIPLAEYARLRGHVLPVLPFPGSFSPAVVVSPSPLPENNSHVSPVLLSGLKTAVYDLIPFLADSPHSHWEKESAVLAKLWKPAIPYLVPAYGRDAHEFVFRSFLGNGIVIQPEYISISALPAEISEGEKMKFLETADKISRSL